MPEKKKASGKGSESQRRLSNGREKGGKEQTIMIA